MIWTMADGMKNDPHLISTFLCKEPFVFREYVITAILPACQAEYTIM